MSPVVQSSEYRHYPIWNALRWHYQYHWKVSNSSTPDGGSMYKPLDSTLRGRQVQMKFNLEDNGPLQ